jgi:hypothetical protein
MIENKRFLLVSKKGSEKKTIGSYDTYEEACNAAETLKSEMVYCHVEDKELNL